MHLENHTTTRLRFRKLTMEDLNPMMEFFKDPAATKYLKPPEDRMQWGIEWIDRQIGRYENGSGLLAIELIETGELVGQCGLLPQVIEEKEELEVGYHLIPKFWKNGYAIEAAKYAKEYALENKLADTIISLIDINNIPSQKVAEKNGMVPGPQIEYKGFSINVYRTV